MKNIRQLHRKAMELSDQAYRFKRLGEYDQAYTLFQEAYLLEYDSALQTTSEPSRGILFRSAATLALHARLYREAEKAVAMGLAGDPYPEFAQELREVYEEVNFHRHLHLQGIVLNPNEMQLTMVGNAISQGMALTDAVFTRVKQFERLFLRTAQRLNNKPFGRMTKGDFYNLYISQPRSGSFAVTLRVGEPYQKVLPGMDNRFHVINEVIHGLDLLNNNRINDLRHVIDNSNYFESFLRVAKQIAPDGDQVSMIGVTTTRDSEEVSVGFKVNQKDFKPILDEISQDVKQESESESNNIVGELMAANAIKKNNIKIIDDSNKTHTIEVSFAIAEDIVRPYFGRRVQVDVIRKGQKLYFQDLTVLD